MSDRIYKPPESKILDPGQELEVLLRLARQMDQLRAENWRLYKRLSDLVTLWHDAPSGFREGLRQYYPAEYAKWVAAMKETP